MHGAAIIAIAEKPLIGASGKEGHTGKANWISPAGSSALPTVFLSHSQSSPIAFLRPEQEGTLW
jgi:hypothetical protein